MPVVSIRTLFRFLDKLHTIQSPTKANQSMKRRRYTSEELRVKKIVKSKGWGAVPAEWTLGLGMTLGWVPPSSPPHHQSLSYLSNPYICSNIIFSLSLLRRLRSRLLFLFFSPFFSQNKTRLSWIFFYSQCAPKNRSFAFGKHALYKCTYV